MITPPSGNRLNLSYFRDRKQVLRLDTLYQQNHCGVYRSDNGGQDWRDITEGLPSRFGFVLGIDSQDPDTIYVLPEDQVLGTDVGGGYGTSLKPNFGFIAAATAGRVGRR